MMETERAEAIVLRCRPVTESSLVVTWFTRELGKLTTLAKGARRPKSPLRGKIDLFFFEVRFEFFMQVLRKRGHRRCRKM